MSAPVSETTFPTARSVAKPEFSVSLFVDTYSANKWGEAPAWCQIRVDEAFIQHLCRLQSLCRDHKLARIATYDSVESWDQNDSFQLSGDTMLVDSNAFWFESYPRHGDDVVETRIMPIDGVVQAWRFAQNAQAADQTGPGAGLPGNRWAFTHNSLFYCDSGDVQDLVDQVFLAPTNVDDDRCTRSPAVQGGEG